MDHVFDSALTTLFQHERGYSDRPDDPGGPTAYGISLRQLRQLEPAYVRSLGLDVNHDGVVDELDLRLMTPAQAAPYYLSEWWNKYGFPDLAGVSVRVKLFDAAVNIGPGHMAHVVQRALRACNEEVVEDGMFGPRTRQAINCASPVALLAAIKSELAGYYRLLAQARPELEGNLKGWLNRAYD